MDGKNLILDKIIDMKEEFQDIKEGFQARGRGENIESSLDRLSFIEEKLDLLKLAILDEATRLECLELRSSIDSFKKEARLDEYDGKLSLIKGLKEITDTMYDLAPVEVLRELNKLFDHVHLTMEDIRDISKDRLVYTNQLGNRADYEARASRLSLTERFDYARELTANLFDFSLRSYEASSQPFSLYEKIMIINILDTIKFYLEYRDQDWE